jgi:hypothetical protein
MIIFHSKDGLYETNESPNEELVYDKFENISSAESRIYHLECSENRGGFCIVKYNNIFYVCDRSEYENVAGYYNHNEHLMDSKQCSKSIMK